jgi:hypothetical protein
MPEAAPAVSCCSMLQLHVVIEFVILKIIAILGPQSNSPANNNIP